MGTKLQRKNRTNQSITPQPVKPAARDPWALSAVVMIVITFAAYSYLFYSHAGFIWDDPDYVVNNQNLVLCRHGS